MKSKPQTFKAWTIEIHWPNGKRSVKRTEKREVALRLLRMSSDKGASIVAIYDRAKCGAKAP